MRAIGPALAVLLLAAAPALAGVVAGKVVDEEGNPLGGVEVSVHDPVRDQWVVTDSSPGGRFSLDGHWEKPVALLARKEGYLPAELDAVGPIVRDLVVVLRKPGRLAGRVIVPMGNPAEQGIFINLRPLHPELAGGIIRVDTDAEGRFRAEGLREGWYDVLAVPRTGPPALLRAVRVPAAGPVELRLPEKRGLAVDVRDEEGAAVPHVKVWLRYLSDRWGLGRPPVEALTNLEGRAVLEGLPIFGGALVVAEPEGRPALVRRVDLAKEGQLELRPGPVAALEGRGPGGAAEGERVRLAWASGLPERSAVRERGVTFLFENVPPGLVLVSALLGDVTHFEEVSLRGGRKARVELGSVPGKAIEVEATVDGRPASGPWIALAEAKRDAGGAAGSFAGGIAAAGGLMNAPHRLLFGAGDTRAVAEVHPGRREKLALASRTVTGRILVDGKAVGGALLLVVPLGGPEPPEALAPAPEPTRTDASGRFESPRIAGGPWGLVALDEAHAPACLPLEEGRNEVDVSLPAAALLRVTVTDGDGRPAIDARVTARDPSGRLATVLPRRADADGVAILLLAPGTWTVEASAPDLGTASTKVKLGAEGAATTLVPALN